MIETSFFKYGDTEMDALKKADAVLGAAMMRIGKVDRATSPDLFSALVYTIIGQLISVRAADKAWARLQEQSGAITPISIASQSPERIQACGITMNKSICIHEMACRIVNREFDLEELPLLSDEDVIQKLTSCKGIGRWTAEMLLLHSLQRPDVVSWGDAAIRRGMMKLYGLSSLDKKQFDQYRLRYSPYGSVASIYLWEISIE
ncbi:DNA-3-methyladenine glycosylase 2 family protein [Paenibacillus sp. KQZ6P-2]|uniref:DNA-3-methyladenine glycosylase II n=2 Tax=Paenibacillus mangrovi TaxID=2931978 RepID=A0A9X2B4U1_9BACL|nr:DNA-3-methyladenine glycosylase 2 family protein [Paenibacillus mangrovi]MCJ8014896.1 DNA-3-methyladenine glycosylase 2 family protein [Paenibacillus mangrovi]